MYTGVFLPRNELGASDREEAEKLTDSSSKIFPRRTILLRISTATIRFECLLGFSCTRNLSFQNAIFQVPDLGL